MMFGHIEGYADRIHHMELVRQWQDLALGRETERQRDGETRPLGVGGLSAGTSSLRNSVSTPCGHYKSFISWPFQRENTPLGRLPHWGADASELAKEFPGDAVARAYFDPATRDRLPKGQRSADAFDFSAMSGLGFASAELFGKRVRMSGATDYLRTQALSRLYLDNIYSIGASWVTMGPHIGQVALAFGASDMGSVMMEENVVSSAGTTYCLDETVLCHLIRGAGFTPAQRDNVYDLIRAHHGPESPDLRVSDWSAHRVKRLHHEAPRASSMPLQVTVGAR